MMTRRDVLRGAGGAGLAAAGLAPAAAATAVAIEVPPGACDCHVHVVGDQQRFPMTPDRVYTPPAAGADELLALQRRLRFDRVVIVQPSFYGIDNAATLDGLRQLGPRRARGIAVIDDKTSPAALDDMVKAGVRGIRLNLETAGEIDPAALSRKLQAALRQIAGRGWHVQIYTRLPVIAALASELAALPVPLVVDHFGGAQAALGAEQPGFGALTALVRSGKAYVKISGAYRVSRLAPDYADAAPLARALIAANPERIVWGTDWPHTDSARPPGRPTTDVSPFQPIDDGLLLNQLPSWAPDAAIRRQILVDNPARLYGF
jgi:predicted TIM-barrel fold metal-dependent hydrolase